MRRIPIAISFLLLTSTVLAQQTSTLDPQALLQRMEQLEKRVRQLESELATEKAGHPGTSRPTENSTEPAANELNVTTQTATSDSGNSLQSVQKYVEQPGDSEHGLHIRGFGQAMFYNDDLKGDRAWWDSGNLTLLLSSHFSEKLSAMAEVAFAEHDYGAPQFDVGVRRAVLQYRHNDYLNIDVGRYYSSIGYYNTAFYSADWAQTTIYRPWIASFQDQGGLAPMQRNGVSVSGRIPSGGLGLHYVAEVGGGDIQRMDLWGEGYQYYNQARTGFNIAIFARPAKIPGLQIGGSFFHDTELPTDSAYSNPTALVRQNVASGYVVYSDKNWEFFNEAYLFRHEVKGGRTFNVPGFYTQVSRRVTPRWRPYFRFTYLNPGQDDPMVPDVSGNMTAIEAGARYNFTDWVGLKLEYERAKFPNTPTINAGASQVVFTF